MSEQNYQQPRASSTSSYPRADSTDTVAMIIEIVFGLFGVMEKFASLIGPLLFAAAGLAFGSSRPAILSLIVLFIVGILLLTRVNVDEGRRVAKEEDAEFFQSQAS